MNDSEGSDTVARATDSAPRIFGPNDLGNAQRLLDRRMQDLRYVPEWGRWLVWDGKRWQRDKLGRVVEYAKDVVLHIHEEALAAPNSEMQTKLLQWSQRSQSLYSIKAMIKLAETTLALYADRLDANPSLLTVENGTLDLNTGELRPHKRGDRITKMAPVAYDAKADCPTWEAFLKRIMDGNGELIRFLQRAIGYSLTGDVSEQALFFLYGTGANGKTTFLNTVLELLGDYGKQAAPDLLVVQRGESHPTGIADLVGTRFAASVEVEEGKRLAETLVKQLTGGDRVKARFMREDFFEFMPTHKIFLAANHKPVIRGTDHAIWRRIRMIPFAVTFLPEEQDRTLAAKLRTELTGILAWAVRGCLDWRRLGLNPPADVTEATETYREEMDQLGGFLGDCCIMGSTAKVAKKDLYETYESWCKDAGDEPLPKRIFGTRLTGRGVGDGRTGQVRFWVGIRLRDGPSTVTHVTDDDIESGVGPVDPPIGQDDEMSVILRHTSQPRTPASSEAGIGAGQIPSSEGT